ncbi:hypothetical protein Q5752_003970 [Cryptotrichosporon argae]
MSSFPPLSPNPHARLTRVAPGIYTADSILLPSSLAALQAWARALDLDPPRPAGRGEAERTGRRLSLPSPTIAAALLPLLLPFLPHLDPPANVPSPALSSNIRIYHYPLSTYFRAHYDEPQPDASAGGRRTAWTVLLYLTECEGGATAFHVPGSSARGRGKKRGKRGGKKGGTYEEEDEGEGEGEEERIRVAPRAGRVLFHWHGTSHGGCLKHEGEEVRGGDKWVLRTDVLA